MSRKPPGDFAAEAARVRAKAEARAANPLESTIQTEIMLAFGNLPWLRLWRANTGAAKVNGQWVRFGVVGQPDLMGLMLPGGRMVGIEVKSKTGKQRVEQQRFEEMMTKFGGLYILARSVADVWDAMPPEMR